jgi:hypothetical protein
MFQPPTGEDARAYIYQRNFYQRNFNSPPSISAERERMVWSSAQAVTENRRSRRNTAKLTRKSRVRFVRCGMS